MTDNTNPAAAASQSRRGLVLRVAAAAALAGAGLAWWRQRLPPAGVSLAGGGNSGMLDALWALRAAQPGGGELAMHTLRGKPLLLNFWATWCPPCVQELPEIDRFHRAYSPKGWQVVALAIDSLAPVQAFLAKTPLGFAIGLAGLDGSDLVRQLGNVQGGLPFTVMIGADGALLQRKLGPTNFSELSAWADQVKTS